MADSTVTDLTAIGALADDDEFYVVADPAGTPLNRKATAAQVATYVRGNSSSITGLTAFASLALEDLFIGVDDPSGTPVAKKATGTQVRNLIQGNLTAATIASGTLTDSAPGINLSQTWNDAADTFKAVVVTITSTASASGSLLYEGIVGGTQQFAVRKDGFVAIGNGLSTLRGLYPSGQNLILYANGGAAATFHSGSTSFPASIIVHDATAIPAGGTAGAGYRFSSTSNFGVFFGSGAPTLAAAKGSLYLRSDGSGTGDRAYINTDGGTTWTALTTAA